MHARITERTTAERTIPKPAVAPAQGRVLSPRRPLVWGVAAALAVTGLVAADVVFTPGQQGVEARAAQVLERAAEAAILSTDLVVGPGQFLKIVQEGFNYQRPSDIVTDEGHWIQGSKSVFYIPADRGGDWMIVRTELPPTDFHGGPEARADAEGRYQRMTEPGSVTHGVFTATLGGGVYPAPSAADFSGYSRDPDALYRYFDESVEGSGSHEQAMWVGVNDLVREPAVPADLRAALFRVLARIPGVEVQETGVEIAGQAGVAFSRVDAGSGGKSREELIVDPANGRVIGSRDVLLEDMPLLYAPAGTVLFSSVTTTSVIDHLPDPATFPNID
ncbi:CU044_5270 family protein [Mycetocola tolaasinivorans]|nr:CU044_5270 family protein [Mycetocola tolaasinivorans]